MSPKGDQAMRFERALGTGATPPSFPDSQGALGFLGGRGLHANESLALRYVRETRKKLSGGTKDESPREDLPRLRGHYPRPTLRSWPTEDLLQPSLST
jgi:hypothetical protein